MKNVVSAGGIVTKIEDNKVKICLVSLLPLVDKYVFPKGHVEKEETIEQAALREVREEIGLNDLVITKYLGMFTKEAIERSGLIVTKDIHLFLMKTNNYLQMKSDEIYKWFLFDEAEEVLLVDEKEFFKLHKSEIYPTRLS